MRSLWRDRYNRSLAGGMSKKLDHSSVNLLTDDLICAARGLENWFHLELENGYPFTLR
jgi:hypothetical protein